MEVMRSLVRRYVTAEQKKSEELGVTEDDVNEIKQDISTFRFELIDILRQNGMDTSKAASKDHQGDYFRRSSRVQLFRICKRNISLFDSWWQKGSQSRTSTQERLPDRHG
jgi:hypothetical protein